ncbi:MAG: hypothetical protein M1510_00220 [Nitrospirae bacterium]|nr:hypothetical protein [Nitrospirota bacterium]
MSRKVYAFIVAVLALALAGGIYYTNADARYKNADAPKVSVKEKAVKVEACYGCHAQIKELHTMGKHAKVNCSNCHKGLEKHLSAPGPDTRPVPILHGRPAVSVIRSRWNPL